MCNDAVSRWLVGAADVEVEFQARVARAYEDLATRDTPVDYHAWVSEQFGLDLSSEYGGQPIGNPWGKASGQLSMTPQQVADDPRAVGRGKWRLGLEGVSDVELDAVGPLRCAGIEIVAPAVVGAVGVAPVVFVACAKGGLDVGPEERPALVFEVGGIAVVVAVEDPLY